MPRPDIMLSKTQPHDRELFAIADLAREFGISTRTIRFYESKGLLSPERVGGTRVFRKRDRVRLILILRGKRLGFSLKEISNYLSLYDADSSHSKQAKMLIGKIDERLSVLEQQLTDLQTTIGELKGMREVALESLAPEAQAD